MVINEMSICINDLLSSRNFTHRTLFRTWSDFKIIENFNFNFYIHVSDINIEFSIIRITAWKELAGKINLREHLYMN